LSVEQFVNLAYVGQESDFLSIKSVVKLFEKSGSKWVELCHGFSSLRVKSRFLGSVMYTSNVSGLLLYEEDLGLFKTVINFGKVVLSRSFESFCQSVIVS